MDEVALVKTRDEWAALGAPGAPTLGSPFPFDQDLVHFPKPLNCPALLAPDRASLWVPLKPDLSPPVGESCGACMCVPMLSSRGKAKQSDQLISTCMVGQPAVLSDA